MNGTKLTLVALVVIFSSGCRLSGFDSHPWMLLNSQLSAQEWYSGRVVSTFPDFSSEYSRIKQEFGPFGTSKNRGIALIARSTDDSIRWYEVTLNRSPSGLLLVLIEAEKRGGKATPIRAIGHAVPRVPRVARYSHWKPILERMNVGMDQRRPIFLH